MGKKRIEAVGDGQVMPIFNTEFIQIDFNEPLIASILCMIARDTYYDQSPNSFEIFGIHDDSLVSLRRFDNVFWKPYETKLFAFYNIESIKSYKVIFYSTLSKHFGLSEFNIGEIK